MLQLPNGGFPTQRTGYTADVLDETEKISSSTGEDEVV